MFYIFLIKVIHYFITGSKQCIEEFNDGLLNLIREAISHSDKKLENEIEKVKPEKIGKKVADNVEHHSSDTKRGEVN